MRMNSQLHLQNFSFGQILITAAMNVNLIACEKMAIVNCIKTLFVLRLIWSRNLNLITKSFKISMKVILMLNAKKNYAEKKNLLTVVLAKMKCNGWNGWNGTVGMERLEWNGMEWNGWNRMERLE
ncbi:hypothetical protein BpHYR1_000067 [Brachionus plicatilis]|uniref:Uncharacterized protein n=1 Tax=Brachionus plicatilis TaxID=10195 RepID=A0A3M7SF84_BRAPC|nr:hypothetical protein BpHYR1_000067 [Brachionus plicatilis]